MTEDRARDLTLLVCAIVVFGYVAVFLTRYSSGWPDVSDRPSAYALSQHRPNDSFNGVPL